MGKKKSVKLEHTCTLSEILNILGGKWVIPIVYTLFSGKKRFSELERSIPNINTRMLVKELKNLEEHGILLRQIYATVPPTVEYSLTEKGKRLEPVINEIYKWGQEFIA